MPQRDNSGDLMTQALGKFTLPPARRRGKIIHLRQNLVDRGPELARRLEALGLAGMAQALTAEPGDPGALRLVERLIQAQEEHRCERLRQARLRRAGLPVGASLDEVDLRRPRGLVRSLLNSLATCAWLEQGHHLVISGPSGVGKTYLSCALARQACDRGFPALYRRTPEVMAELLEAARQGRLSAAWRGLLGRSLLVLDDWDAATADPEAVRLRRRLLEARRQHGSVLLVSQRPLDHWAEMWGADGLAMAQGLENCTYLMALTGPSLRAGNGPGRAVMALDGD